MNVSWAKMLSTVTNLLSSYSGGKKKDKNDHKEITSKTQKWSFTNKTNN